MLVKRLCLLVSLLFAMQSATIRAAAARQPVRIDSVSLFRSGDKVQMVMEVMFDREQVGYNDILLVES